jgi:adenine-specific DNA-methyltransferase
MNHIKKHGQYFTKNKELQNKVYKFVKNKPKLILEPSCGAGHLIINYPNKKTRFDCYELDENIDFLIKKKDIKFGDFLKQKIKKKYLTIIGNPPYVKTNKGNLYIDFIDKCVDLLKPNGELIFIIPSDFLKLTSATKTINKILEQGNFTHIYHPNNEHLFENATIDVIIFRYEKTEKKSNKILYNNKEKFVNINNGIITFSDDNKNKKLISDFFDAYVGLVTGKEEIFKNKELGNFKILNDKDQIDDYILIKKYPSEDENINEYMKKHKEILMERKIKKFNENNWFEFGALRNISKMKKNLGKECIYVKNLTRNVEVAFKDKVNYFGGKLILLLPKENLDLDLDNIVKYLNSDIFKNNYLYSKRFKIGQKQLLNGIIPGEIINISETSSTVIIEEIN